MLIVEIMSSKTDRNGNRYFAIRCENKATGKHAIGTVAGASNVTSALVTAFGDFESARDGCHWYETTHAIREFDRATKSARYAGCRGEEIIAWLVANVGEFVPTPA